MPLRAYCEERFRITDSLGPGSALGKKGKKRCQIRKISASEASRARFFFFFGQSRFFSSFPHNEEPGPTLSVIREICNLNHEHQNYFWNVNVLREKKNKKNNQS